MNKRIIPFEEFEQAAMQKILERDTPINVILRQQYKNAYVKDRSFSGAGFFTDFYMHGQVPHIIEPVEYAYGDVEAIINDISGFSFILFIKNGVMKCLEGYTWRESWPDKIYSYKFVHKS